MSENGSAVPQEASEIVDKGKGKGKGKAVDQPRLNVEDEDESSEESGAEDEVLF